MPGERSLWQGHISRSIPAGVHPQVLALGSGWHIAPLRGGSSLEWARTVDGLGSDTALSSPSRGGCEGTALQARMGLSVRRTGGAGEGRQGVISRTRGNGLELSQERVGLTVRGKFFIKRMVKALENVARGSGEVTIPGYVKKACGCFIRNMV